MRARSIAPFASASCSVRCIAAFAPVAPLSLPTLPDDAAARCASPENDFASCTSVAFSAPLIDVPISVPIFLICRFSGANCAFSDGVAAPAGAALDDQRSHARAHDQ